MHNSIFSIIVFVHARGEQEWEEFEFLNNMHVFPLLLEFERRMCFPRALLMHMTIHATFSAYNQFVTDKTSSNESIHDGIEYFD